METNSSSAKRLQKARERAGYSGAKEVADVFGWPGYHADEAGDRPLAEARARLYAHAFGVDVGWLLFGNAGPSTGTEAEADRPQAELLRRIERLNDEQRATLLRFLDAMQGS
jgi:hypothetical protein